MGALLAENGPAQCSTSLTSCSCSAMSSGLSSGKARMGSDGSLPSLLGLSPFRAARMGVMPRRRVSRAISCTVYPFAP